jgi:hypothetical protein
MPNKQCSYGLAWVVIALAVGCTAAPEDETSGTFDEPEQLFSELPPADGQETEFIVTKEFFRTGPSASASTSSCTYGEPCETGCTQHVGCCTFSDKGAYYKGWLEPRPDGCYCVAPSWARVCALRCGTC